jgi:cell division protein FtsQ
MRPRKSKTKSHIKSPRRTLVPFLKKLALWNGLALSVVGGTLIVHYGVLGPIAHSSKQGLITGSSFLGWKGHHLLIEGRKTLSEKDLKDAIQFNPAEPLLNIDIGQIYTRLKKNMWINKVCVKKIYPGTLYIKIEERKPYCCVLQKNRSVVVDRSGVVLHEGLESYLPKVKGPGAHLYAHEILDVLLQFKNISPHIDYIERKRSGRFDLFLKDGIRIALPQENVVDALHKLSMILEKGQLRKTHMTLDLRVPDKIIYTGINPTDKPADSSSDAPQQ